MSADAVILIPGVKGNHLVNTNTHDYQPLWRDVRFNIQKVEDLILTESDPNYDEKLDVIINAGQVESLAYKEFMDDLETDLPKYYFTYDWRKSNRYNATKLHEFIEMLKAKSKAIKAEISSTKEIKKVNIVTHSMGNHICRFYINDYSFESIHRVVFVTPPFLGSLAMVEAFVNGQGWFRMKKRTREIVKSFPGAIELLPRYKHAAMFKDDTDVDFLNIEHWQSNLIYSSNPDRQRLNKKFKANLAKANEDLSDLDKWKDKLSDDEKGRILVIVRDEFKTLQSVRVNEDLDDGISNVVDIRNGIVEEQGDKVVAHGSSCCYCKEITTLAVEDSVRYDDDSHAFFMTEERLQMLVSWFFDDTQEFKYNIPGNSIKKVNSLKPSVAANGLKYFSIEKE